MSSEGRPAAAEDFDESSKQAVPQSEVTASLKRKEKRREGEQAQKVRPQTTKSASDSGYDSIPNSDATNTQKTIPKSASIPALDEMVGKVSDSAEQKTRRERPKTDVKTTRHPGHKASGREIKDLKNTVSEGRTPRPVSSPMKQAKAVAVESTKKPLPQTSRLYHTTMPQIQPYFISPYGPLWNQTQPQIQPYPMAQPQNTFTRPQNARFGSPMPTGLQSPSIYYKSGPSSTRIMQKSQYTEYDSFPHYVEERRDQYTIEESRKKRAAHESRRSQMRAPRRAAKYDNDTQEDCCSCHSNTDSSSEEHEYFLAPVPPSQLPLGSRVETRQSVSLPRTRPPRSEPRSQQIHRQNANAEAHMVVDSEVPSSIRKELEELRLFNSLLLDNVAHNAANTLTSRNSVDLPHRFSSRTARPRSSTAVDKGITITFAEDSQMVINGDKLFLPRGATMRLPNAASGTSVYETDSVGRGGHVRANETSSGTDYLRHPSFTQPDRPQHRRGKTVDYVTYRVVPELDPQR